MNYRPHPSVPPPAVRLLGDKTARKAVEEIVPEGMEYRLIGKN
jgi:hypothetical protein